jgi:Tol biopolymer transport system component
MLVVSLLVTPLACSGCGAAVDHGGELRREQGQIAFTRITKQMGTDIEADIYTINVDGSGERRLTDTPGLDGLPSWSPEAQRVAFVSDRDGGNWEIYVMDSDGTQQRRLTNTPEKDEAVPAWSPNGEKIAYVTGFFGDPSIWVMDADGSGHKRLVDGNWPSWSPDGERIVYTTFSDGEQLAVMSADGSGQRELPGVAYEAAWSPNGKQFAYVTSRGMNNEEIYVMNTDGTERTRLTDIPGNDHWPPTWSPDGTRIAFTSDGTDDNGEIYVMNSDGSGLTKLTDNPAYLTNKSSYDSFPAWRPRVR